jgi:hypothetical protein
MIKSAIKKIKYFFKNTKIEEINPQIYNHQTHLKIKDTKIIKKKESKIENKIIYLEIDGKCYQFTQKTKEYIEENINKNIDELLSNIKEYSIEISCFKHSGYKLVTVLKKDISLKFSQEKLDREQYIEINNIKAMYFESDDFVIDSSMFVNFLLELFNIFTFCISEETKVTEERKTSLSSDVSNLPSSKNTSFYLNGYKLR